MKILFVLFAVLSFAAADFINTQVPPAIYYNPPSNDYSTSTQFPPTTYPGPPNKDSQLSAQKAAENEFKLMWILQTNSVASCGGSFISENWVVTAAHCGDGAPFVAVFVGRKNTILSPSDLYRHPGFKMPYIANNIMLVHIPDILYSSSIQPVRLPAISSHYSTYANTYAIASGWGSTSDSEPASWLSNYARLQVISDDDCAAVYGQGIAASNIICVSTHSGSLTCDGDSGVPLVSETDGVLIGIASFINSNGCSFGNPALFTRITSYLKWIRSLTGIAYYRPKA